MRQPIEFRIVGAIIGTALAVFLITIANQTLNDRPYPLHSYAVRQIRAICGFRAECKVRAGDLFPGEWDTFRVFPPGTSQGDLDEALGTGRLYAHPDQELYVLSRNHQIVSSEHEVAGLGTPAEGQIEFLNAQRKPIASAAVDANTWLWASTLHTETADNDSGFYFVLSPDHD